MAQPLNNFTIRRAAFAEVLALRHAELRAGMPIESAMFPGDDDPLTFHFGVFDSSGANIGCASFMPVPWEGRPAYQLRGMATRGDFVKRGVGAALLKFADAMLRDERGVKQLWCNARLSAVGFYEKQGWAVASPLLEIPTAGPHHRMTRAL
jgi:GNAT superfamily N-acetyltransferase